MSQDAKGDASSQRAGLFGTGQGWRPSFSESRRRAEAGPAGIACDGCSASSVSPGDAGGQRRPGPSSNQIRTVQRKDPQHPGDQLQRCQYHPVPTRVFLAPRVAWAPPAVAVPSLRLSFPLRACPAMSHAVQGPAPCLPFSMASTGVSYLVGGKGKLRHWRHKTTPGESRSHAHSGWGRY